jgi:hypothetical protein
MNRPYGAVDVAANLKGAVPKAATQKILVALAEKGELVQKVYGDHCRGHHVVPKLISQQGKRLSLSTIRRRLTACPTKKLLN